MCEQSKVFKKVLTYGRVNIGKGAIIQDNVILGNKEDKELIIGDAAIIRSGTIVYSSVKIGNNFKSGHNVLIRENTNIGDNVLVGTNSVVDGDCIIGNNVSIQTGVYIARFTTIEDDVFLGPCSVTTNDKYMKYGSVLKGPIIKKGVRIGANSAIMPGVVIGEGVIVGAGSVVTKNVPPNKVVVGVPAKIVKDVLSGETESKSEFK